MTGTRLVCIALMAGFGCAEPLDAEEGADGGIASGDAPVIVDAPAGDLDIEAGGLVLVAWRDADGTGALVDVVGDVDGDPATTFDQVVVARAISDGAGADSKTLWDTTGVQAREYRLLVVAADGGIARAPGSVTVVAAQAPTAEIVFPPALALTSASAIAVRGRGSDTTGIESLSIGGVPAASDDGFRTWTADVPLEVGLNALEVRAVDSLGNEASMVAVANVTRDPDASSVGRTGAGSTLLSDPKDLVLDMANGRALVIDRAHAALFAIDLATGERSILSSPTIGSGVSLGGPNSVALDGGRAIVGDAVVDVVAAIGLDQGARSTISASDDGGGSLFDLPRGIAVDSAGRRLLLCDGLDNRVLSVNLDTGGRSVVSSGSRGDGPGFDNPFRIALDSVGERAFLVNRVAVGSLVELDLVTGNRTIVADALTGTGTSGFEFPGGLVVDLVNRRALVMLTKEDILVEVDLATGNRFPIAGAGVGRGPAFDTAESLAYDPVARLVYAVDTGDNALVVVDEASGDRVYLSK